MIRITKCLLESNYRMTHSRNMVKSLSIQNPFESSIICSRPSVYSPPVFHVLFRVSLQVLSRREYRLSSQSILDSSILNSKAKYDCKFKTESADFN